MSFANRYMIEDEKRQRVMWVGIVQQEPAGPARMLECETFVSIVAIQPP
jgi:hypothetical protein